MMAIRNADIIIADNKAIQDYVIEKYHRTVELITYGEIMFSKRFQRKG